MVGSVRGVSGAGAEEEASLQAQFTSELSHQRAAQQLFCQNLRAEVSLIPHVELQSKKEIEKLQVAVSYWKNGAEQEMKTCARNSEQFAQ
mgnify:CR=1 FL=1